MLCLQAVAHVVLLLLVTGEYADLPDVAVEETAEDGVSEAAGAAGDKENFIFEDCHIFVFFKRLWYNSIYFSKQIFWSK